MRLRQIEIFRAVMQAGSVSAAARALGVSQPVVSRVLAHTELSLGLKLFERAKGRLLATAEARLLYRQVERAWGEVERIASLAENLRRGHDGQLRIALTPSLASGLLPDILSRLQASGVASGYELWASHSAEIEAHLVDFTVDLGLAIEPPAHVALHIATIAEGAMVLALPRTWLAEVVRVDSPQWLAQRPYIGLAERTPLGERLARLEQLGGWQPLRTYSVQTYALAGTLVEQGLGYALVDGYTAAGLDERRVALMAIRPGIGFRLCLMANAAAPRSILQDRFETCLCEVEAARATQLAVRLSGRVMQFGAGEMR